MLIRRFAAPSALLWLAIAGTAAAQQVCPVPPSPAPACLALAVGQVHTQALQPGEVLCVEPGAVAQEFTVVPVNWVPDGDAVPTFLAHDVVPVSGPPSPRPADETGAVPGAKLAPLDPLPMVSGAPDATSALAADDEVAALLASTPRADLLVQPRRGVKFGSTPPQVDDLLDIQVALGCTGTPDMRKARIEAVSPEVPGKPRLYLAQEVEFNTNTQTWNPAVPGGYTRTAFESLQKSYDMPVTSPQTNYPIHDPLYVNPHDARDTILDNYGAGTDVDGNGGVVVFFTRRMNEASPPASSIVVPARFLARDLLSAAPGSCPLSNEGEIVYVMVPDPTGVVNSNVRTLSFVTGNFVRHLAYQMVRLTSAGRRLYAQGSPPLEDTWLEESLAWVSSELLFYRNSLGLAPRGNIVVTNLTTGPNASRRVAAFNTFQNQMFGALRSYYSLGTGSNAPGRNSVLQASPLPLGGETADEQISYFYGVTAMFLRYALDRADGNDAQILQAIIDSPLTGKAKLDAVFGADMRDWARDFGVAFYADDNAFLVDPQYRTRSWNFRSIYTALNGSFQILLVNLAHGTPYTPAELDRNAGLRWLRFGVATGTPGIEPNATFRYSVGPTAPITPLRVAVVRTK